MIEHPQPLARPARRARMAAVVLAVVAVVVGTRLAVNGGPGDSGAAPSASPSPSPSAAPSPSPEQFTLSVPWLSGPVRPEPSPLPDRPFGSDSPPCGAAAFETLVQPRPVTDDERVSYLVVLKNVTDSPCVADGYPRLAQAVRADGSDPVTAETAPYDRLPYRGADVPPGGHAHLIIETDTVCRRPKPLPRYPRVVVTLPGGGSVEVRGSFDVRCTLRVGRIGVPPEFWPPTPSRYAHVTATITAPPVAPAGSVLRYHVTLTSSRDMRLDPCPSYRQSAQGKALVREYHLLNCAGAGAELRAGEPVRFEMRIPLPDEPERTVTIDWRLQNEPGVQAEVRLTVP